MRKADNDQTPFAIRLIESPLWTEVRIVVRGLAPIALVLLTAAILADNYWNG